jgi:hypothetical protein
MARSVTAMIRYREEASPEWEELLPKIIACARRVVKKTAPRQHSQVIRSLYDFACNRCDDAALRIMSERALDASKPPWTQVSVLERDIALNLLYILNDTIQVESARIKEKLCSS